MKKEIINNKLNLLSKSKFRSSFHLRNYMIDYIKEKGMDTILEHSKNFVEQKLASSCPKGDGHQTPMKGHPSFVAMHATATCCRGCLERWHHIPKGRELTQNEKNYIITLIIEWIKKDMKEKQH